MFPNLKQQGFSIVTAIFLIVVMALLAVGMVKLFSTGQQSIGQEITSLRAYLAAQSGLQTGMYQVVYAPSASGTTHNQSFTATGLTNTSIQVSYSRNDIDGRTFYLLNAVADYAALGNPEYSRRNLQLKFSLNP